MVKNRAGSAGAISSRPSSCSPSWLVDYCAALLFGLASFRQFTFFTVSRSSPKASFKASPTNLSGWEQFARECDWRHLFWFNTNR
jgi:hypothetical protein